MYILYGVNTQPRKGNERMPKTVFDIGEKIGFLTVVGVVSAGTLAAATAMDPSVPQAVTGIPTAADPIHAVIEQHRKAVSEHNAALNIHCAFEQCGMQGEKLEEYERLVALTDAAYYAMSSAGCTLVNTPGDDGRYPRAL
jgi:hypothetical protein